MAPGDLSEVSIKRVISSLNKRVGLHPGFTAAEKKLLNQHHQQVPRPDSVRQILAEQDLKRLIAVPKVVNPHRSIDEHTTH